MSFFQPSTSVNTIKKPTVIKIQPTIAPVSIIPIVEPIPEIPEKKNSANPKSDTPPNCEGECFITKANDESVAKASEPVKEILTEIKPEPLQESRLSQPIITAESVARKRAEYIRLKEESIREQRILNRPNDQRRIKSTQNLIRARQVKQEQIKERKEREEAEKKELKTFLNASDDSSSSEDELMKGGRSEKRKQKIIEKEKSKELCDELKQLKEMIYLQNKRNEKLKSQMSLLVPKNRKHYNSSDDDERPRRKQEPVIINIEQPREHKTEHKAEPKMNHHEMSKLKTFFGK